jgi:phosphinothricin acetyltransferase
LKIRRVEQKDYQRVLDILNKAIEDRIFTALLTTTSMEERKDWFIKHSLPKHPMYVAEIDDHVVGWITLGAFRDGREGFLCTSELSYYIDENYRGQGIGSKLMDTAIEAAKEIGCSNLLAVIFDTNIGSQKLAIKKGFKLWGHLPDVIEIDGKTHGCDYWGLKLEKS